MPDRACEPYIDIENFVYKSIQVLLHVFIATSVVHRSRHRHYLFALFVAVYLKVTRH